MPDPILWRICAALGGDELKGSQGSPSNSRQEAYPNCVHVVYQVPGRNLTHQLIKSNPIQLKRNVGRPNCET